MNTYIRICVYVFMCVYIHTYTYITHTHTHTQYIHTHAYTPPCIHISQHTDTHVHRSTAKCKQQRCIVRHTRHVTTHFVELHAVMHMRKNTDNHAHRVHALSNMLCRCTSLFAESNHAYIESLILTAMITMSLSDRADVLC